MGDDLRSRVETYFLDRIPSEGEIAPSLNDQQTKNEVIFSAMREFCGVQRIDRGPTLFTAPYSRKGRESVWVDGELFPYILAYDAFMVRDQIEHVVQLAQGKIHPLGPP